MATKKILNLVGYASGLAGAEPSSAEGPLVLQHSPYFSMLEEQGIDLMWRGMIKPDLTNHQTKLEAITRLSSELAAKTIDLTLKKHFFIVLGGDHSSAIGTWSGVVQAKKQEGPIGLIWIDAHMDSHTPETSPSGNIHGMPLACLLGYGDDTLVNLMGFSPKLNPEKVCLIGVRSFEDGEAALLKRLNVRVFFMEEVKKRGLSDVFEEALQIVNRDTVGYGVSIDVDSMDPSDAPGTGVVAPEGLSAQDLKQNLQKLASDSRLLGVEIVEFAPQHDLGQRTEKLIPQLISAMVEPNPK